MYTPGVVTSVLVNLPLMSLLVFMSLRERWISGGRAAVAAIAVPLAIACVIPTLLLIGRVFN